MKPNLCPVIAITNNKGGVGKTTTAINLAQALALHDLNVLLVDLDPQGNATQGVGIPIEGIRSSVADLIMNRDLPASSVIYRGDRQAAGSIDIIPATPALSRVEREMVAMTNSELRLSQKLRPLRSEYSVIVLDTPPTFGTMMNSALNCATGLIIPVDSSFFAMMGIKELLSEVNEIRNGTNPGLNVLGYLLTLVDPNEKRFGFIRIRRSWNNRFATVGPTKGGYWRTIPVSSDFYCFLVQSLQVENLKPNDYLLPRFWEWDKGEQARILRSFCIANGLPSVRFHTLRACFATQLISTGIPATVVMKICGWKDMKTMQRYIRLAGIDEAGATEALKFIPTESAAMEEAVKLYSTEKVTE